MCLGADGRDRTGRDSGPGVICHTYASRLTGDEQPTHNRPWSCVFGLRERPSNPHAIPLHSNMLMYLRSALIGPSDARPAPPVFMGSLQSVLQSGPRHCVRACSANIMQTNTSLLFGTSLTDPPLWKKGRKSVKGKGEREKGRVSGGVLEFISVIT